MKIRVISSLVGIAILVAVLSLFETIVLNIAIALLSVIAVFELLSACGCTKHKAFSAIVLAFALVIPFLSAEMPAIGMTFSCFVYIFTIFIVLLRQYETLRIEVVSMGVFFGLVIPFAFSTVVYMRNHWGAVIGVFYVLMALASAWLSDTSAYFCGRAFGKRKLAPKISPKKTVEGAVGGVVFGTLLTLGLAWVFQFVCSLYFLPVQVNFLRMLLIVPVQAVAGIMGDLSASVIKRQFDVKDYGSIMPGHGGVMDRFDSALMILPLAFMFSVVFSYISVV